MYNFNPEEVILVTRSKEFISVVAQELESSFKVKLNSNFNLYLNKIPIPIMPSITPLQAQGKVIIGKVPLAVACKCISVFNLEIDESGFILSEYKVTK
jgi:hypothetical protein